MSHPVFFVAPKSGASVPRWTINSNDGRYWNVFDERWASEPEAATLYADESQACIDCAILQRRATLPKPELVWANVPIQVEALSDRPLEYESLKNWLMTKLRITIDISDGTGPTPDALVFVCVDWGKFQIF